MNIILYTLTFSTALADLSIVSVGDLFGSGYNCPSDDDDPVPVSSYMGFLSEMFGDYA